MFTLVFGVCAVLVAALVAWMHANASGKWEVVERKEAADRVFYVLVNQRGDELTTYLEGTRWYDVRDSREVEFWIYKWLHRLEKHRELQQDLNKAAGRKL